MITYFAYGPTLCLTLMAYLNDTFHDAVSKAVVTNSKLDLYVNNYSHLKTLWSTLLIYLKVNLVFTTL
jgi:hypothetical protein